MSNSIILSFNGVDFRLDPILNESSQSNNEGTAGSISVVPNANGKFTMIKLESFSGTLFVSEQSKPMVTFEQDHMVQETPTPNQMSLATVEVEESPSPSPPRQPEEIKKSKVVHVKGQQQLTFERKKRTKSNDDVKKSSKKIKSSQPRQSVTFCKKALDKDIVASPEDREKQQVSKVQKVSPLQVGESLGQSSMHFDTSDNFDSESDGDFVPPEKSSSPDKPNHSDDDNDIELTRKPSIQELVHQAEDLTQAHNNDDMENDDLSYGSELKENSIVVFDEYEDLDKDDYFEQNDDTSILKEEVETCAELKTVDKNMPSPRWGSTMTMIDNSKLLVYGGQGYDTETNSIANFSDLHVYDLNKKAWKKPVNCEGMPRTWHTSTFLPDRSLLISFGGERYNPKTKKTQTTDQVMVLDTEIMLWYPPSVSGQVPTGRSGHTASLLQSTNELVVFGGVKNNKWQNSLAVLDTMRWKWMSPKIAGDAPRARSYHSATPVPSMEKEGSMLVIFGGNNETECFNTVHVLDTTSEDGKWSWFHPSVSGTPPSPRTGHCAILLEDQKTILIYGGWDPNDEDEDSSDDKMICGDSFLLDTESWTWKPGPNPKFSGDCGAENGGKKRTGACALLAPGDDMSQVLVFGGRIPNDKFANDFQSMIVPQRMIDVKLNKP